MKTFLTIPRRSVVFFRVMNDELTGPYGHHPQDYLCFHHAGPCRYRRCCSRPRCEDSLPGKCCMLSRGKARTCIETNDAVMCVPSQVVNFDMPGNLEDYIHRIGRTGAFRKRKATGSSQHCSSLFRPLPRCAFWLCWSSFQVGLVQKAMPLPFLTRKKIRLVVPVAVHVSVALCEMYSGMSYQCICECSKSLSSHLFLGSSKEARSIAKKA